MTKSTINIDEIKKFEKISAQWWDPDGKFKPLHLLNPIRLEFIVDCIKNHFKNKNNNDIHILDVGCGGGLVVEPLSNLDYNISGIDASLVNIEVAKAHQSQINSKAQYFQDSIENHILNNKKYDVVLALEIIEHVDMVEHFIESCTKALNEDGILIISTINKNVRSYLETIIAAEYILKWVPKGTHQWNKFLPPSAIAEMLRKHHYKASALKGIKYNLIKQNWYLSENPDVNYIIAFKK